jgi:four helix bundle protein
MNVIQKYTDLEVWLKSRELTNSIYTISKSFPEAERFGLTNQMRRCAVSVPSNIAEGCARSSFKETVHFLYIARGSLYELETQLYLSLDQKFISNDMSQELQDNVITCKKLLNGFINYYKSKIE